MGAAVDMGFWEWFGNYWWWALIVTVCWWCFLYDKPSRFIIVTCLSLGIGGQFGWDADSWGTFLAWTFGMLFFLTVIFTELLAIILVPLGLGAFIGYKAGG